MKAYYIPNGPKNLATVFPTVNFNNVEEYYIHVKDADGIVMASSSINRIGGECCSDKARIHFLNYLGAIDSVNFKTITIEHESKGEQTQNTTLYPLTKSTHTHNRMSVVANDILTLVSSDYREEDNKWLNELVDSPMIWLEWKGIQGQPDSYIPAIILDTKMLNIKQDERYQYELLLQIKLSNERYIIRN